MAPELEPIVAIFLIDAILVIAGAVCSNLLVEIVREFFDLIAYCLEKAIDGWQTNVEIGSSSGILF
jgi:hypothetical protein